MLTVPARGYKPESISRKSHMTTFMMSSIDPIYQRVSLTIPTGKKLLLTEFSTKIH